MVIEFCSPSPCEVEAGVSEVQGQGCQDGLLSKADNLNSIPRTYLEAEREN